MFYFTFTLRRGYVIPNASGRCAFCNPWTQEEPSFLGGKKGIKAMPFGKHATLLHKMKNECQGWNLILRNPKCCPSSLARIPAGPSFSYKLGLLHPTRWLLKESSVRRYEREQKSTICHKYAPFVYEKPAVPHVYLVHLLQPFWSFPTTFLYIPGSQAPDLSPMGLWWWTCHYDFWVSSPVNWMGGFWLHQ